MYHFFHLLDTDFLLDQWFGFLDLDLLDLDYTDFLWSVDLGYLVSILESTDINHSHVV